MQNQKERFLGLTAGAWLIVLGAVLVVIDQVIKVLVKTNMCIGESIPVIGDFFRIAFVENEGMAFGMAWGGSIGKIILSTFRIILFGGLVWWISLMLKKRRTEGKDAVPFGVCAGLAVIAAGALGNIIDCWFYGLLFSESTYFTVAEFGGVPYAPFLLGKVVDMFSFSIFPPVFNFADACVSCGAAYLILFQWRFFSSGD